MNSTTSAIKLFKVMTGAAWFLLGAAFTVILYPLFTAEYDSEHTSIHIHNNTSDTIYASVFPIVGPAVSDSVTEGNQARLIFHKGEFTDEDFPSEIRVQITDSTQSMILNQQFPISTNGTTMISRPVSFTINESATDSEQTKIVEVEIIGRPTP